MSNETNGIPEAQEAQEVGSYDRDVLPPLEDTLSYTDCPACNGAGVIMIGEGRFVCPQCEGTGIKEGTQE